MANVAALLEQQVGKLFSTAGIGGVSVVTTAEVAIRKTGTYNTKTAKNKPSKFMNWQTGSYDEEQPPVVNVIPRTRTSQQNTEAMIQDGLVLLMQPNPFLEPQDLVNTQIHCMARTLNIVSCAPTYFGGTQVVWELVCR